jgi:drug/metabolite transporter (DMT)-like permease
VAVILGWAILGEAVTTRTLLAGAVIVTAVALIVSARPRPKGGKEPVAGDAEPERVSV